MTPAPYYDRGGITIYHGDCREIMPGLHADVLITDPPYGENYASSWPGKFRGRAIANDHGTEARDAVLNAWGDRPAAVFGKWSVPKWGNPRGVLVWSKGPASGMGDLSFPWKPSWEDVAIYGSDWSGHRDEAVLSGPTVVTWSGRPGSRQHPNEKPVWLLARIIGKAPIGILVDPFMGSGTTLRAAKDMGRKAIGIEIDESYCEYAARRMGQEVLPLARGEEAT